MSRELNSMEIFFERILLYMLPGDHVEARDNPVERWLGWEIIRAPWNEKSPVETIDGYLGATLGFGMEVEGNLHRVPLVHIKERGAGGSVPNKDFWLLIKTSAGRQKIAEILSLTKNPCLHSLPQHRSDNITVT